MASVWNTQNIFNLFLKLDNKDFISFNTLNKCNTMHYEYN